MNSSVDSGDTRGLANVDSSSELERLGYQTVDSQLDLDTKELMTRCDVLHSGFKWCVVLYETNFNETFSRSLALTFEILTFKVRNCARVSFRRYGCRFRI